MKLLLKRSLVIWLVVALVSIPAVVSAASSTNNKSTTNNSSNIDSQAVTQGYGTDQPLQTGMIVKLKDKDATKVVPLDNSSNLEMLGVVVAASDTPVTLSNDGNSGQVFVASFGHFDVLVSNQNGPIKAGDYITISALAGVGMKADTTESFVLGKATAGFDGTGSVASTASLKDATGKQVKVSIGRIPVNIVIAHNPLQESIDKNLPGFLKQASQYIANKPVSATRVYISLVVLALASLVAGSMLYSGIRGGLIAIGRNPLAKKQIVGGIFRVVLSGVIVFLLGLFGVYLLLKL